MTSILRGVTLLLLLAGAAAVLVSGGTTSVTAQAAPPCTAVPVAARLPAAASSGRLQSLEAKRHPLRHDDRGRHLDALYAERAERRRPLPRAVGASIDVGEIAVLQDGGDLMVLANPFDLRDVALRLTPNALGGYDVGHDTFGFRETGATALALADDDSSIVTLPFQFPFYGQRYSGLFVNSDGNLTFNVRDVATTQRSLSRMLTGAPRIAPFFADLDPSAGGTVFAASDADRLTVTWCAVPAFDRPEVATVQVTLFASGVVEMQVSSRTTIGDAVIGVSPGATEEFQPLDLSEAGPLGGGSKALGERFTAESELNLLAVTRRFISTHSDTFDNVTIFTDQPLIAGDGFAFELSIANQIEGIGVPLFNGSPLFGSAGRLQSICQMDMLGKYPDDPHTPFLGANNTVSVLGQEFGHRWLTYAVFRGADGLPSSDLLGRDGSHWSFFVDSDASVMEGNDIADLGGGAFVTTGAVGRYSLLDQYFMGLVDQSEVPPFFYVADVTGTTRTAESAPRTGVAFNGVRREVTIDQVTAMMGPRSPSAASSAREMRQAFIYVTSAGRPVMDADIRKLDRIRLAWEQFVSAATDSRLKVVTALLPPPQPGVTP